MSSIGDAHSSGPIIVVGDHNVLMQLLRRQSAPPRTAGPSLPTVQELLDHVLVDMLRPDFTLGNEWAERVQLDRILTRMHTVAVDRMLTHGDRRPPMLECGTQMMWPDDVDRLAALPQSILRSERESHERAPEEPVHAEVFADDGVHDESLREWRRQVAASVMGLAGAEAEVTDRLRVAVQDALRNPYAVSPRALRSGAFGENVLSSFTAEELPDSARTAAAELINGAVRTVPPPISPWDHTRQQPSAYPHDALGLLLARMEQLRIDAATALSLRGFRGPRDLSAAPTCDDLCDDADLAVSRTQGGLLEALHEALQQVDAGITYEQERRIVAHALRVDSAHAARVHVYALQRGEHCHTHFPFSEERRA